MVVNRPRKMLKAMANEFSQPHSLRILGVRIDDVTMEETIQRIKGLLDAGHFQHVVTVNPEFIMTAQHHPTFRTTLEAAALAVPDGVGLLWAARWQRQPLRERVTGVGLTKQLAALSVSHKYRIFLLGAAPGVAEQAAAQLRALYGAPKIVGTWAGSPRPEDVASIREQIQQAQPDILLVAYGSPVQDLWLHEYGPTLGIRLGIGVGGTFDYLAGVQAYAPELLRRYGLEWLYRLVTQPQRWRRIWTAVVEFSWAAWREARQVRSQHRL